MDLPDSWVLQQTIVDVQYGRGVVFLDKCGSLLLALEDALGKPFSGSVSSMDHGELRSTSERILVTYGQKNLNASQNWVKTPARIEHVAPIAWDTVSDMLGVGREVTRCGVRFVLAAKVETQEAAETLLAKCELAPATAKWKELAGGGAMRGYSAVVEDERGRLRVNIEILEIKVEGQLPEELAQIVPNHAISLDLDNVFPGKGSFTLSRSDLKEFIRSSWQRSRKVARLVGTQLGLQDA